MWWSGLSVQASSSRKDSNSVPATPVGGFANVTISSGSGSPKPQSDIINLDTSQKIRIASDNVTRANEYQLDVSCPNFENSQDGSYVADYSTSMFLARGSSPAFEITEGMIPTGGGRECKFLPIASGEDDLGNSIGATLYGFSLSLTGGTTGLGGMSEDSLKIVEGTSSICLNTEGQQY